jgi:hypothetical protein
MTMTKQIVITEAFQETMFDGPILIQSAVIYPKNKEHEKELRKQARSMMYNQRRKWPGKCEVHISVAEGSK